MATYTSNYNLKKPDENDFYSVHDSNDNMDLIDAALEQKANKADIPTSLPADGGDADTVGGKEASDFAPATHTQPASTVSSGTLGGKVQANATATSALEDAQVRDIVFGTTEPTELPTGSIYVMYE